MGITNETEGLEASRIAKGEDLEEVQRLVQLILGVAIECEDKAMWIGKIMQLEASAQRQLRVLIEELLKRHRDRSMDSPRGHLSKEEEGKQQTRQSDNAEVNKAILADLDVSADQQLRDLQAEHVTLQEAYVSVTR